MWLQNGTASLNEPQIHIDEIVRIKACNLSVHCFLSDEWLQLLEESVTFVEEDVKTGSVKALGSLWESYYTGKSHPNAATKAASNEDTATTSLTNNDETLKGSSSMGTVPTDLTATSSIPPSSTIDRYVAVLSSERESHVQGMAMALGACVVFHIVCR